MGRERERPRELDSAVASFHRRRVVRHVARASGRAPRGAPEGQMPACLSVHSRAEVVPSHVRVTPGLSCRPGLAAAVSLALPRASSRRGSMDDGTGPTAHGRPASDVARVRVARRRAGSRTGASGTELAGSRGVAVKNPRSRPTSHDRSAVSAASAAVRNASPPSAVHRRRRDCPAWRVAAPRTHAGRSSVAARIACRSRPAFTHTRCVVAVARRDGAERHHPVRSTKAEVRQ